MQGSRKGWLVWGAVGACLAALACSSESTTASAKADAAVDVGSDGGPCSGAATTCDDGDACTQGDHCAGGVCVGTALVCDDGLACTEQTCDKGKGCVVSKVANGQCAVAGACVAAGATAPGNVCLACSPTLTAVDWSVAVTACDDNTVCTTGDACSEGNCTGKKVSCDDGNPCTVDVCDAKLGCQYSAGTGPCDDGNPCSTGDFCAANLCHGATATVCDDKDPCTLDGCDKATGCTAVPDPKVCDDSKPCTQDLCDKGKCTHPDKKPGDSCTTGDPCLTGQVCTLDLLCQGGGPLACDDKNPCTQDSCKPFKGCVHVLAQTPCDDGESCTDSDTCVGGECIGLKTGWCPKCTNTFEKSAGKMIQFQIGASGNPGEGFDVDGDIKTCAPAGNCSGGIDNSAAVLGAFINKGLIAGIQDGTLTFVAELQGYKGENIPFVLNLYAAQLTPASAAAGCQPQADVCEWYVEQGAMTATCQPKFSFKDAKIQGGKLTAGTKDTLFAMQGELNGANEALIYVKGARIEGTVTFASDGVSIQAMQGVLGGAIPMSNLQDVIAASGDGAFGAIGLTKDQVIELVKKVLKLDQDLDGDGDNEAASVGIRFSAVGAKLAGMKWQ